MAGVLEETDLPALNEMLARRDAPEITAWAAAQFGKDLVMTSSFGADAAVLLHMANQAMPGIRVIFVDTGYHFPETFKFMEDMRQRLKLNVHVYRTLNDPQEFLRRTGETDPTRRRDPNGCCEANKREPFNRAIREMAPKAWLRGIRRNQASTREGAQFIEWSTLHLCHVISPLLSWTDRQIYLYMKKYELPYHPLRDQGYLSIGCSPCTRAVTTGEDPRAGRWAGQGKVECGINLINSLDSAEL